MAGSLSQDVLFFFDVGEESRDFLCHVMQSGAAPPHETQWLRHQSLLAGADDWNALIECARSVKRSRTHDPLALEGQDDLSYVWSALFGLGNSATLPTRDAWERTDRLISLAQKLERDAAALLDSNIRTDDLLELREPLLRKRRRVGATISHYWGDETVESQGFSLQTCPILNSCPSRVDKQNWFPTEPSDSPICGASHEFLGQISNDSTALWSCRSTSSPYFSTLPRVKDSPKRPPAGTVSCIRFPPLSSPRFGIIQEETAHDPFWLLMAVTFLIKTSGQLAIPAMRHVRERFPTPGQLGDPANEPQLTAMIRHLGLVVVRVAMIQKYARIYLDRPPRPGVRFRVRNYEKREVAASGEEPSFRRLEEPVEGEADADDDEAWEIGHMTQGRYALDSWRIFCRDELLGRAEDWNGKRREAEFQPEWMRVMPADKELRAYLRWMWMREGWEWDPKTGDRTVLREAMRRAVEEGRVEYDETGGLRMDEEKEDEEEQAGQGRGAVW
ncbi:hypothetical protein CDD80_6064 [Ophiocordyceps camponoti-rufipedis]|uniref:HhH-GPD domain-containing protein n=1 Tax=Ophiocordyceps camponoti-rufipedis TaxID=2004952 RepID=A0A2C5YRU7_9HYPO|nr:hypothetical protein CDD80_6064 [Ophiocordyceps camponoti-rufipedis]